MKLNVGDIVQIKIDRLTTNGGRGLGRHLNFVLFVPDTAPGDIIEAKITLVKKSFGEARLHKIIEPSPSRKTPPCKYHQRCGGCQWQHINYEEQLNQKLGFLNKTTKNLELNITPTIVASPNQMNYRNRIQLNVKNKKFGYFQSKTHNIVEIKKCLIADKKINNQLKVLSAFPIAAKRFEVALDRSNKVVVRADQKNDGHQLFSQVNNSVNQLLTKHLITETNTTNYTHIYDAYCGQGNFSFPLHKNFADIPITAIEFSRQNIKYANSKKSSINFIEGKVETYFTKKPAEKDSLVLLDPPRSGCTEDVFKNINQAKKIIYISCDLATFERDTKSIISNGYELNQLTGFDMFPQTSHLEVCGIFNKI